MSEKTMKENLQSFAAKQILHYLDEDPEKNRRLREYSEGAAEHPSLGFRYACPPEMEARMAALNNAADSMNNALTAGAVDPAAALPQYISSLKAAGLDELRADAAV